MKLVCGEVPLLYIAAPVVTCQTYPDFGYYNIGTKRKEKKNINWSWPLALNA
jgi:hypothetical protein